MNVRLECVDAACGIQTALLGRGRATSSTQPASRLIQNIRQALETAEHSGVFIGTDYFVTPSVFFNAELSIFSETSIFLMVGYGYPAQH